MTITKNFERFQYFNFVVLFLVEITEIEKAAFSYKTALSQASAKIEWQI